MNCSIEQIKSLRIYSSTHCCYTNRYRGLTKAQLIKAPTANGHIFTHTAAAGDSSSYRCSYLLMLIYACSVTTSISVDGSHSKALRCDLEEKRCGKARVHLLSGPRIARDTPHVRRATKDFYRERKVKIKKIKIYE